MPWLQLHIAVSPDQAEVIEECLLASGAVSVTYQDREDQPILEPALGTTPLWSNTRVTGLFDAEVDTAATTKSIADHYQLSHRRDLPDHQWEALEDRDWEREWMDNYHPIQCGKNLWICPSWIEPPEPEATNVLLDPGLAFGTGTHPTTLLCLRWLGEQQLASKSLLDYGCGSGILAIAGALLGATLVEAVDNDPQALLATRDNASRNGIDHIAVFAPDQESQRENDVLIANILAEPLIALAPKLTRLTAMGGQICLSGLLESQAGWVMDAYRQHFHFDEPVIHEGWARLSATRTG